MPFQVATGNNNAGALASVTPQPRCGGLKYPVVRHAASGSVVRDGTAYTEWEYGFMTPAQWTAFLTAHGATYLTKSIAVTIRTLVNNLSTFANYNATAVFPEMDDNIRYERGQWIDIVILYKDLEAL